MARGAALALCAVIALTPGAALAHTLKLFATAIGSRIEGSVYFVGGGTAPGARVRIATADGTELAVLTTANDGTFAFVASARRDHVIVADSGDGHQARLVVPASRFPPDLPAADGAAATAPVTLVAAGTAPPEALPALIEEAVARQIAPLRRQIEGYEDRVRWRDVLGGLGYIAGLAGLAAWIRARRRRRTGDA